MVGLFQGRIEFGPWALGCRSISSDARSREMLPVMNLKINFRESLQSLAPIILRERMGGFFEIEHEADTPYMLLVADLAKDEPLAVSGDGAAALDKLKVIRSEVPELTQIDNSARV